MSGPDTLYVPHHHMGPRCTAQTCVTYPITTWAPDVRPRHALPTPSPGGPPDVWPRLAKPTPSPHRPRCPAQTRCTFPIIMGHPISSPYTLYLPNHQTGPLISGPDTLYLHNQQIGPPMSSPDPLYFPHHHTGHTMSSPDTLYVSHHHMGPRSPAQTRVTYPITTWASPMSGPTHCTFLITRRVPRCLAHTR